MNALINLNRLKILYSMCVFLVCEAGNLVADGVYTTTNSNCLELVKMNSNNLSPASVKLRNQFYE